LKCDIRKFFASIDHATLEAILARSIPDEGIITLLSTIIGSFDVAYIPSITAVTGKIYVGKGLPLGNLTSQLLVNIYMNEFDQFVKHLLKAKYYVRYADDFVILSHERGWLVEILPRMAEFLRERLALELHPGKISIRALSSGVNFLGWVHFPDHRVLRAATKRRMFARLQEDAVEECVASYRGLLKHGNSCGLREVLNEAEFARMLQ
jgi:hypothetical protein